MLTTAMVVGLAHDGHCHDGCGRGGSEDEWQN